MPQKRQSDAARERGKGGWSAPDHFRNLKGHFQTLFGIQARVAGGQVVLVQFFIHDVSGSTCAFGHVFTGHFEMDSPRNRPFSPVGFEKAGDF